MRLQILPLPSVVVGDDVQEPFALIVDQWPDGAYDSFLQGFADACGAKAVWVVPETVEVVDRYAELSPSAAVEIDRLTAYLLKHFSEVADGVRQLEQTPVDLAIRLLNRELTRRHEEARKKAVAAERKAAAANSPEGAAARRALGIAGSMFVAEGVPHGYNDSEGAADHCIVCGLGRLARIHESRCANCGKPYKDPACGPGHAMASHEIGRS
jgi:hypothetical protein